MTTKTKPAPAIFWHSDPVKPNDTIVLSGEDFAADAKVTLTRPGDKTKKDELTATVKPTSVTNNSLKVVVPADWPQGIFNCQVTQKSGSSKTVSVNAPDSWWIQGDEGIDKGRQGGWLRIQGKCLSFNKNSAIALQDDAGKTIDLKVTEASCYSIGAELPDKLKPAAYSVIVNNGCGSEAGNRTAGSVTVLEKKADDEKVINVMDYGADPTGKTDSTLAVIQAVEYLGPHKGGVVYFPRGRYRIDSNLRSGTYIKTSLKLPNGVTLRGEGMDLVTLWWPDQKEALPCLIEGSSNFGVEDLAIYTQGEFSTIIYGESNTRINRVRIRASRYYMTGLAGRAHHGRSMNWIDTVKCGPSIVLWGDNVQVTDCDIATSTACFDLRHCKGGVIANNQVRALNFHFFSGGNGVIFENNEFTGYEFSGGSNIALHFGARSAMHYYYANNKISHIYTGDHEAFTLDGHATAYMGKIKTINGTQFELVGDCFPKSGAKGSVADLYDQAVYVIDGRGRGQYRWLVKDEGNKMTIDRPWDAEPDDTSLITIGGFNGRHLFIGNTMSDTGTMLQLYPPNCECIVAENKAYRTSNLNSLSKLGKNKEHDFVRVEMSWYNQFLENNYVVGNGWGGGCTEIDRWIGGETCLNIWGWQVYYYSINGADHDEFLTAPVLQDVLGEKAERATTIPLSIFQIVRRHKVDNNSFIRVRGAVSEILIEDVQISDSAKGIQIDSEINYDQPADLGQLFDFSPTEIEEDRIMPFLQPTEVMIRNSNFNNVDTPYSGTAIDKARIIEK